MNTRIHKAYTSTRTYTNILNTDRRLKNILNREKNKKNKTIFALNGSDRDRERERDCDLYRGGNSLFNIDEPIGSMSVI